MAEMIKVSTEEMQSTLNAYNTQKASQTTAYESMKNTISGLSGDWQGEASNTFQNQFQQFYTNIAMSEAKMQDAVDELAKSADLYQTAENETKGDAGSLDVGRSPFA